MTQCSMVLEMLRRAGSAGVSSLEITLATNIVNVTGRVSDLREEGHLVECFKVKGINRYRLSGFPANMKEKDRLAMTEPGKQQDNELIPRATGYGVP